MSKKVLVLDIDGTLTNSRKEITPATKRAVQEVLKQGHKVILASGRPTPGTRRYERELELGRFHGYLLGYNGAEIVDCRTGRTMQQYLLPLSVVPQVYAFTKEWGLGLMTYSADQIISAYEPDEYVLLESQVNQMPLRVVENFTEYVNFDIHKCLITTPPEKAQGYVTALKTLLGETVSVYRSEAFYIEIMPQNVDKATSLHRMLTSMGIGREDTICCGDSFNDIPMVQYAGVGVAMGNAKQALKDVADYITDTNDRDGLVPVIEKFILKEVDE